MILPHEFHPDCFIIKRVIKVIIKIQLYFYIIIINSRLVLTKVVIAVVELGYGVFVVAEEGIIYFVLIFFF